MKRIDRTYIPIADRDNFGQLQFPTLKDNKVTVPTLSDMRADNVSVSVKRRTKAEQRVSKANKKLNEKLGALSEFRQIRYNVSYKDILDIIGEDFPMHPEFLYVIDIILKYYGQNIADVLELATLKEKLKYDTGERTSMSLRTFNAPTSACLTTLIYFLYVQYQCNPDVLMQIFSISIAQLRSMVEQFSKQYDNSATIRADYSNIHSRLMQLQPLKTK